MRVEDLFVGEGGRLRLGWRLLAFAALLVTFVPLLVIVTGGGGLAVQSALTLVAAVGAGWIMLAVDGRRPAALGFHVSLSVPGEVARGWALGFVVAAGAVAAMALAGGVRWSGEPGTPSGWMLGAVTALGFFLVAAAAEEAIFRGYPFQALAEAWGPGAALVVTSAGFGLVHLNNPNVGWIGAVNVAGAGLFLGAVYVRTASLWWATGAHAAWNWTHGWLGDLPVSGLDLMDAPWVVSRPVGPEWLSGGAFGPEASLVTTWVVAAGAAWTWRSGWLKPPAAALDAGPLFEPPGPNRGETTTTLPARGPRGPAQDSGSGGRTGGGHDQR